MKNILNAQWIKSPKIIENSSSEYSKEFSIQKTVKLATVEATAYGVYEIELNGKKVGDYILAPGWTSYKHRLQVEAYDITSMLSENNTIVIGVAGGWKTPNFFNSEKGEMYLGVGETAVIAAIEIEYTDGTNEIIYTDESWLCRKGKTLYSHIYNGYTYDPSYTDDKPMYALPFPCKKDNLTDRVGEKVTEHEYITAKEIIITPKGETVLDFGQNVTGYVQFKIKEVD